MPMKRSTYNKSVILLTLAIVLYALGIPSSLIFLGLWVIYLTYNLYSKFQYRKGKADYILFPVQNDQFTKTTSIILGIIIFAISVITLVWQKSPNLLGLIGLVIGLLVFLNGLFDVPKGMMKIVNNKLSISGLEDRIDVRQLKEVNIYKERMLLTNVYEEVERIDQLAIDPESSKLIQHYISINNAGLKVISHL